MSNHVSRFGRSTNPPDYPFSISLHFSCCRLTFCLFFLLFLAFPSLMVADEATDPGQITFRTSISNFDFEKIDPYTGHLTLTNKDVSLPGNGGLDLNIYRVYKYSRATTGYTPFGYHWELHFGRLREKVAHRFRSNFRMEQTMLPIKLNMTQSGIAITPT